MKKIIAWLVVMTFCFGFAATANTQGDLGITVGVEFTVENTTEQNEGERQPILAPFVIFERPLLNRTLDVYAQLAYNAGFYFVKNDNLEDVHPHWLYINVILGYNLFLTTDSTLTILLEKEFDKFMVHPRSSNSNNVYGLLIPGVRFDQELDFGNVYAQLDLPIAYLHNTRNTPTGVGLDFTLGWLSNFGLGLELTQRNIFRPRDGNSIYAGFDVTVSYELGPIFAALKVETPLRINEAGINIIPSVEYSFDAFTFYFELDIRRVGMRDYNIELSPTVGLRFSF